jgi:hypothetical protein
MSAKRIAKKVASKKSKAAPVEAKAWAPKRRALMLRSCNPDMTAHGGFVWPKDGYVEAPDWRPSAECGNGLHGLLWGEGDILLTHMDRPAQWLVVEVDADEVVDLGGKVKVPRGNVIFCGERHAAATLICSDPGAAGKLGNYGTATAGYCGTATAGNYGTATAGYRGTATAGNYGTATAGNYGTATAGEGGTISIQYWDEKRGKYRVAVAEVGENGIKPNTVYAVDGGKFVERVAK